jgi:hypothetical protein
MKGHASYSAIVLGPRTRTFSLALLFARISSFRTSSFLRLIRSTTVTLFRRESTAWPGEISENG